MTHSFFVALELVLPFLNNSSLSANGITSSARLCRVTVPVSADYFRFLCFAAAFAESCFTRSFTIRSIKL